MSSKGATTSSKYDDKFDGLEEKFMESREKERIKQILIERLQSEGWVDKMKQLARQEIRQHGIQNVTVEMLFDELKMTGRKGVSNAAKTEVYELIKKWIQQETDVDV